MPTSAELPRLWPDPAGGPDLRALQDAPTQTLTDLCDDYWNSFLTPADEEAMIRHPEVHRRALEILASRSAEALTWAQQRLAHDNYAAREDAAALITQWAGNNQLGDNRATIARDLVRLATTYPVDDTKEAQAASAALQALAILGGPACLMAVRQVLTSEEWDEDDHQWDCAEVLAGLTGEPFMDSADPIEAARAWLASHPSEE